MFAAGAGPGSGAARKETVDRDAAILLADAAQAAGVRRYVMVSAMAADPEATADDEVFQVYLRAKGIADEAIRERTSLDWTIVRPGGLTNDAATGRVTVGRVDGPRQHSRARTSPQSSSRCSTNREPQARASTSSRARHRSPKPSPRLRADGDTAGMPTTPDFETLLYTTEPPVATITLNRPDELNTIVPPMPDEVEAAVGLAEHDPAVKVIVLRGAGRAFSGGYNFGGGFHHWDDMLTTDGRWDPGKDFVAMTSRSTSPTPEVPGDLAGVEAGHRSGTRLVRRRRKRLRAVPPTS